MPELPEVETTVRDLRKKVLNRTFIDVWTDFPKMIKIPKSFKEFKKRVKNKKIKKVLRAGKNIIFELSQGYSLLIHQKLTGHLLYGEWIPLKAGEGGMWKPRKKGSLEEKVNGYIHLLFTFNNGKMLALSDLRKFAKIELERSEIIEKELKNLGFNPLKINFDEFKEKLKGKNGKIKQVLMDQKIIAGIGNIYSSEILWRAKINPFKVSSKLSDKELKKIYQTTKEILKKAIKVKGESISDYRTISGREGGFDRLRKVYRRKKCSRCGTTIKKAEIGGRSVYYCPKCQK